MLECISALPTESEQYGLLDRSISVINDHWENYKNFVFLRVFVVKIIFIRDSAGIIGRQTCRDTGPPEAEAEQECMMNTAGHEKIGDCP
jgi:hypothetical protein